MNIWKKAAVIIFISAAIGLTIGLQRCGAPFYISEEELEEFFASRTELKSFLYVMTTPQQIRGFEIRDNGWIEPMTLSPFGVPNTPQYAVPSHDGRLFFATGGSPDDYVYNFRIDDSGNLKEAPGFGVRGPGDNPNYLDLDPFGRFLYVSYPSTQNYYSMVVDFNTGAFTQINGPFGAGCGVLSVFAEPRGNYMYSGTVGNNLHFYSINQSNGGLTELTGLGSPIALAGAVSAIAATPDGRYLYTLIYNTSANNIRGYAINQATGAISELGSSPFRLGPGPTDITGRDMAMDREGRYLFATSLEDEIHSYQVDRNSGGLAYVSSLGTSNSPSKLTVEPRGRFVYAKADDGAANGIINIYRVGGGGVLSEVNGSPYFYGQNIISLTIAEKEVRTDSE